MASNLLAMACNLRIRVSLCSAPVALGPRVTTRRQMGVSPGLPCVGRRSWRRRSCRNRRGVREDGRPGRVADARSDGRHRTRKRWNRYNSGQSRETEERNRMPNGKAKRFKRGLRIGRVKFAMDMDGPVDGPWTMISDVR